jgi:hypothetical protein
MDFPRNPVAWLTGLTALLAAWIAYQQYRTAKNRLRLDLFDRRWAVYSALIVLVDTVVRNGRAELSEIFEYSAVTSRAEFLFDKQVVDYLERVRKQAVELRRLHGQLHDEERFPIGPERNRVAEQDSRLLEWFVAQVQESRGVFRRYLRFDHIY